MDAKESSRNKQFKKIIRCVDHMFDQDLFFLEDLSAEVFRLLGKKNWNILFT